MSYVEILGIVAAGMAAGTINTIVGSGSLVTFPVLLFFGYPPVTANMSNTIGLVGGGVSGVHGYRRELAQARSVARRLVPASLLGGLVGGALLLVLPAEVFDVVVPVLIGLGIVLVLVAPRMQRAAAARRAAGVPAGGHGVLMWWLVLAAGVYGGYFGAAQGVILVGILGALLPEDIQVLNGIKNLLGLVVNAVSALFFVVVAPHAVAWPAALLLGAGAVAGGIIGARVGRALPPNLLRAVIVIVGLVAVAHMVLT